jgi:hypothetical protein
MAQVAENGVGLFVLPRGEQGDVIAENGWSASGR